MVLTLVSVLVPLAERLRLPHTVLLAVAGLALGFLGTWIARSGHVSGPLGDVFAGLQRLELSTDVFLPLFLPPLLFTAGLTIDVRRLFDEVFAVLLMAIVAVLVCIAGVASAVHLATGIDLTVCLLLGAIVSTTDPAAVIGIFRDVGAPKRLSILAEGESLFNDAVAMAALTVAAYGPTHLHPRQWSTLRQLWHQLEFWSNCLIFVLASMLAANVLLQISWLYVGALLAVAVGAFVARVLVVFGMLP